MKKQICIIFCSLFLMTLFGQNISDIKDITNKKLFTLSGNEKCVCSKEGSNEGFVLIIDGVDENGTKRNLLKIKHYTDYYKECDKGKIYFSISNYYIEPQGKIPDEIFELNTSKGIITKVVDGMAFDASDDGLYICYIEPWQIEKKKKHVVSYYYIYNTKSKKSKAIITEPMKNNYQVGIPIFDKDKKAFCFNLGFDGDVYEKLYFNPYKNTFE